MRPAPMAVPLETQRRLLVDPFSEDHANPRQAARPSAHDTGGLRRSVFRRDHLGEPPRVFIGLAHPRVNRDEVGASGLEFLEFRVQWTLCPRHLNDGKRSRRVERLDRYDAMAYLLLLPLSADALERDEQVVMARFRHTDAIDRGGRTTVSRLAKLGPSSAQSRRVVRAERRMQRRAGRESARMRLAKLEGSVQPTLVGERSDGLHVGERLPSCPSVGHADSASRKRFYIQRRACCSSVLSA
mmetsp:Transcript_1108/g.2620  ORF Transcript_1108/g.2620 Transcript_1108/m.2620 type:complete len:242 (+) Transcript_1108:303-1028(+)